MRAQRPLYTTNVSITSRFLRARKFLPQEAYIQFKDTEIWRKECELDDLYENIDIDEYRAMRQFVSAKIRPFWPSCDTDGHSIHSGLVEEIRGGYHYTCMRLASWTPRR